MTDLTKQKTPTRLNVTIAGNDPLRIAAVAHYLARTFSDLKINGNHTGAASIEADFATTTVNELSADQNNTVNILADTLSVNALQGRGNVYDWPHWGDDTQPWLALVSRELRVAWPTFSSMQKRAIYSSLVAIDHDQSAPDDDRDHPTIPDNLEPLAAPEYNPEELPDVPGVPSVEPADPSYAPAGDDKA